MTLFILAVAGSALLLTQSVIFAPIRAWLSNAYENEVGYFEATDHSFGNVGLNEFDFAEFHRRKRRVQIFGALSKLVSCPMCAGFWLGLAWGTGLFWPISFPVAFLAYGPAGSLVSAIGVAVWLLLVEIRDASAMWRYLNQPKE